MLNFMVPADANGMWEDTWKILIFDNQCRDIISPLFHVADLRKHGVTLFLTIDADRQHVAEVPAVYFVMPTAENIQRMVRDVDAGLYDEYHFNFASSVPRPLLERLADGVVQGNSVESVQKALRKGSVCLVLLHRSFSIST